MMKKLQATREILRTYNAGVYTVTQYILNHWTSDAVTLALKNINDSKAELDQLLFGDSDLSRDSSDVP